MALIESSPSASFVLLKFGLRFPTKWKSILIAIRSDPYQCEEMAYEAKLTRTAPHGSLGYLTPAEYAPDFAYPVSFATLPLRSQLNGSAGASPSQRQVNQSTSQPVDKSISRQVNQVKQSLAILATWRLICSSVISKSIPRGIQNGLNRQEAKKPSRFASWHVSSNGRTRLLPSCKTLCRVQQEEYPGRRGEADTTTRPLGYLCERLAVAKALHDPIEDIESVRVPWKSHQTLTISSDVWVEQIVCPTIKQTIQSN